MDPMFVNDTTDLHVPCTATALTVGIPSVVTTDIDGMGRNATNPTIGAHEISPAIGDFLPDSTMMCNSVDLMPSATGTVYAWSTGANTQNITVSATGTYYLTVTDACGNTFDDSTVVWIDSPTADFAWGVNGLQGVFNNLSTNATSYSWDFGDGNTSTEVNPIHDYTNSGTYTVILTAMNDCGGADTMSVQVTASMAGIEDQSLEDRGINVYPNPTQGDVTVDFTMLLGEDITLILTDMNGRVVYSDMISNQMGGYQKHVSLSDLSDGMYILRIDTENESITKRIVKQ